MRDPRASARAAARIASFAMLLWAASVTTASAQLGSLLSPGRLSRPHAKLEGLSNCQQCHEQGRKVTASKCLVCHQPIADRMARRSGVHKDVRDDCVTCHAEHAGVDAEVRPFDTTTFDHTRTTGFPLDGRHAALNGGCAACHKQRSFLAAKTACASCHRDVHEGRLGQSCQTCHTTSAAFTDVRSRFDHSGAAFQLTGAHREVTCEKCHVNRVWKGVAFASCTSCHQDPHTRDMGASCTTCHSSESWRTRRFDHGRTSFALTGAHQKVDCVGCHKQPATRVALKATSCASCHTDVHKGAFQQDCKTCHNETSFSKAPFDHSQTRFLLTGKHEPLACEACHKSVGGQANLPVGRRTADFRGLSTSCASCHTDVHRAQLGTACESCHTAATFTVSTFTHQTDRAFFSGEHARLTCEKCHVRSGPAEPVRTGQPVALNVKYRGLATACVSCHRDVHLGQEGTQCEACHTIAQPRFTIPRFSHATTRFALTGRHETTACASCHKAETAAFPAGPGTAIRYRGLASDCRSCHQDVHLGQVDTRCETCHTTGGFHLEKYQHRNVRTLSAFFVGRHVKAACQECHKTDTRQFPAGRGTAVRFTIDTTCTTCHADPHRGALGQDCAQCHRP